jgi:hypothetical protein
MLVEAARPRRAVPSDRSRMGVPLLVLKPCRQVAANALGEYKP